MHMINVTTFYKNKKEATFMQQLKHLFRCEFEWQGDMHRKTIAFRNSRPFFLRIRNRNISKNTKRPTFRRSRYMLMNRIKTGSTIKQIVIVHEYLVLELRYCHCCIACRQLVFLSLHSIKYGIRKRYPNVPVCFDIHNISHTRYYCHNHKHTTFNVCTRIGRFNRLHSTCVSVPSFKSYIDKHFK